MKARDKNPDQLQFMCPSLREILNPKQPLYQLAGKIPWQEFEDSFSDLYSDRGRPAKPIRLMVSLLILKQMYDLSDEAVVGQWVQNPYWQFFSGEEVFRWELPVDSSDLTYFRRRLGEEGVEKILQVSIAIHGEKAEEDEVAFDTTVQEKNITFPTDAKLYRRVIEHCRRIAEAEGIDQRQSYVRVEKKLVQDQRFGTHPRNRKKARKAVRKLRTIAGRLVRELERKLTHEALAFYQERLELYRRVLAQQRLDKDKIYSLHEPGVYCMSKGKAHKRYEFGTKVSIGWTLTTGVIVGALNFEKNLYDGHTLPAALDQSERLVGRRAKVAIVDRGYRGKREIDGTQVRWPSVPKKRDSAYERRKARKRFRRRAGIEPVIGHMKSDYRLRRNFLKGAVGDAINVMMSASAFNFKKWMRDWAFILSFLRQYFLPENRNTLPQIIPYGPSY